MPAESFDAIVVGARCAGATLAHALATAGARVTMIDKDTFPSEVISTHFLFPNMVARLEQLGILDRVRARHTITPVTANYWMFGSHLEGGWTPIDGISTSLSLRRSVLDPALIEAAVDAGAIGRFGERVAGVIGAGTDDSPVGGVIMEGGEELRAPWVFGADGRSSIVARSLGLTKRDPLHGGISLLYAYWRGFDNGGRLDFVARAGMALGSYPCEDDVHLVSISADPSFTSGSREERERAYARGIALFPEWLPPGAIERATRISDVIAAPETMLRGYYRPAAGPGWALAGDAGHFKHPASAQGICDAIEQALWIAGALDGQGSLEGYERWRDERSADHYPFSFFFATIPPDEDGARLMAPLSRDAEATQDFFDSFSRLVSPNRIFARERLARWFGDPA